MSKAPKLSNGQTWVGKQDTAFKAMRAVGHKVLMKWGSYQWTSFKDHEDFSQFLEAHRACEDPCEGCKEFVEDKKGRDTHDGTKDGKKGTWRCTKDHGCEFFEILVDGEPQRMFADLDCEGISITREEMYTKFNALMRTVFELRDMGEFDESQVRILNSEGKKISGHWSYLGNGTVFQNPIKKDKDGKAVVFSEQKLFWEYVEVVMHDRFPELCFAKEQGDGSMLAASVLDLSVYSKNKAMRTIYSHKSGQPERSLLPIEAEMPLTKLDESEIDLLEYFIHTPDASDFYHIAPAPYEKMKRAKLSDAEIEAIIREKVPNTKIGQKMGGMIKLINVGTRVCIIGGEENPAKGDTSYVKFTKKGLSFHCLDGDCEGKSVIIHAFQEKAATPGSQEDKMLKLVSGFLNDDDIAEYLIERYGANYRIHDKKLTTLNMWDNHRWIEIIRTSPMQNILGTMVYPEAQKLVFAKYGGPNDVETFKKTYTKIQKLRGCTARSGFIQSFCDKLNFMHRRENLQFDQNGDILGFENGVYDLMDGTFREGRRDDFRKMTVPYDYRETTEAEEAEVQSLIEQIMPKEEERKCLLKILSSCLHGQLLEKLIVMTGSGRNGKDTLCNLLEETIGEDYCATANNSMLTRQSEGATDTYKANLTSKRAAIFPEVNSDQKLQCNAIKSLTGSGKQSGRAVYEKKDKIVLHTTSIIHCNEIPQIQGVDDAFATRLIIVPFRARFLTNDEIKERAPAEYVYPVDVKFKSKKWMQQNRLPFMNILLRAFRDFKADGCKIDNVPESMKALANEHIRDSNIFTPWFEQNYEQVDDKKAYVLVNDIYDALAEQPMFKSLSDSEKKALSALRLKKKFKDDPTIGPHYHDKKTIAGGTRYGVLMGYAKVTEPSPFAVAMNASIAPDE